MVKAIFFDIDGTLVSFDTHKVPKSTRESLQKLKEKGIKLFLATGRSPILLDKIKKLVEFDFDGYVLINGQYCVLNDEVVHKEKIAKKGLKKLISYLDEKNLACEFLDDKDIYINRVNERVLELREFLGSTAPDSKLITSEEILNKEIYQMCAYINNQEEEDFFKNAPGCKGARWNPLFMDIMPEDGGKAKGISKIIGKLGISKNECMAFGDGGNDIDMLEYVGFGIAMGNASDKVKNCADHVTEDVDNDGIKLALEKFNII